MPCPACGARDVTVRIEEPARSICNQCGAEWVGMPDGMGSVTMDGAALDLERDVAMVAREAVLELPGVSAFEVGMEVVRRLVRDYGAEVLEYDAHPEQQTVDVRMVVTSSVPAMAPVDKAVVLGNRSATLLRILRKNLAEHQALLDLLRSRFNDQLELRREGSRLARQPVVSSARSAIT